MAAIRLSLVKLNARKPPTKPGCGSIELQLGRDTSVRRRRKNPICKGKKPNADVSVGILGKDVILDQGNDLDHDYNPVSFGAVYDIDRNLHPFLLDQKVCNVKHIYRCLARENSPVAGAVEQAAELAEGPA